jgi:hypothetical protein
LFHLMLETATALVFAHVFADFLLQSDRMIRDKHRPAMLLRHVGIVTAVSWAALGLAPEPLLLLMVAASHFLIDWLKRRYGGPSFRPFAFDQAAHLAALALAAALFPGAYAHGLWGLLGSGPLGPWIDRLPEAMALGAGLIATVWAGGYAVKALMTDIRLPLETDSAASLPKGGQLIGRLERLMILMLLLADQPDAIGLLIAAKSILRFNELARDADRRASEYVIIGTLASFAWAIGTAWATSATLAALAP